MDMRSLGLSGSGDDELSDKVRIFFIGTLVVAAAIVIIGASSASNTADGLRVLALNLMLGGAAGLLGAVLGFIFGIPRALVDGDGKPTETASGRKSQPNTNLEQISDWLTKILVGATLTSLATAPHFLHRLADFLENGAYKGLPGGGTLAVFVGIYFGALGFYWSYVETRTSLTALFDKFYRPDHLSDDMMLAIRSAPWEPGSPPIPEDAAILKPDPRLLRTAPLLEARAAAETRAGNYDKAIGFYQSALEQDPGNPRLQSRLSQLLARVGKTREADDLVDRLQRAAASNPVQQNVLEASKVYNALYKPAPEGFREAISIGEQLLASSQQMSPSLLLWVACGYGQQVAYNKKSGKVITPEDPDRKRALSLIEQLAQQQPTLMPLARALWRPKDYGGNDVDDDLSVFQDDEDFRKLLG